LNQILNKIGTAAYNAGVAAGKAETASNNAIHAIRGITDTLSMLNSCFYFSASFDPESGEVSYDKRPVFYSSGGSVAVGEKGV
jgi:hypothetical protein